MKRFLIASLLLLSSAAYARITQAPNVSVTAAADDADSVAKVNSYINGMDSNGDNRRVQVNLNGAVLTVASSGGASQSVTLSSVATGVSITVNNTNASAVPVRITGTTDTAITSIAGAAATSYFDKLTFAAATTTYFSMNAVTYASGVAGTSMQYLTLTSKSSLFIDNITTGSIYFVLTNSATPPTNTATIRLSVPTLGQLNLNASQGTLAQGFNFLHWINANTLTPTAQLTY